MNCSPRFLRSTMTVVPTTSSLCRQSRIPFGIVANPLASPGYGIHPMKYLNKQCCTIYLHLLPLHRICNSLKVPGEKPVPVVPCTNEEGPVRCNRCRAYINCFAMFDHSGQKYTCALCGFQNVRLLLWRRGVSTRVPLGVNAHRMCLLPISPLC